MNVTATKHGLRLSQHGVVISELRTSAGPTHSVFDVLAVLLTMFQRPGRTGMLGFAGGGMMAPLTALGFSKPVEAVDLNRESYALFCEHCPSWVRQVQWHHAEAAAWLKAQPAQFGLLLDDLSIPCDRDVVKPDICWTVLPRLIQQRLQPDGVAIFNLMPGARGTWGRDLAGVAQLFKQTQLISLEEYQNRILIAGDALPPVRVVGRQLREGLRRLGSKQATRVGVRTFA